MPDFEIIGVPDPSYAHWFLDASAKRGMTEVRVATPWGAKLAQIDNYRLAQETTPDEVEYIFQGSLGRFAVIGTANSVSQTGNLHVEVEESDEPELLVLLKKDAALTPNEWFFGWDTQYPPQD